MNHEKPLSSVERANLAKIETELRRDAPDLAEAFDDEIGRRRIDVLVRRLRRRWGWVAATAGVVLMGAGMAATSIPIAFGGYVLLLVGAARLLRRVGVIDIIDKLPTGRHKPSSNEP